MSCYHMNIALIRKNSLIRKDGKIGDHIEHIIFKEGPEFKGYEFYIEENEKIKKQGYEYKRIPCGKCIGCKKQQRLEWSLRLEKEAKKYKNNYFITLTYNDEHLPIQEYIINPATGEKIENQENWLDLKGTLVKKDMSQFIKSFRNWAKREYDWDGIKFYGCGEYGEHGNRPHYHIILLNCPKLNLTAIGRNKKTKDPYYTDFRIEHIWGKGYISIGEVNWDSISYTCGYVSKKLFGEVKKLFYAAEGKEPIFANMSRRPGIGYEWFIENKESIYKNDEVINSKGKRLKPPRYYDRLMDIGEHEFMQDLKEKRAEYAEEQLKEKMKGTDLTIEKYLEVEERSAIDAQKRYNRGRLDESLLTR